MTVTTAMRFIAQKKQNVLLPNSVSVTANKTFASTEFSAPKSAALFVVRSFACPPTTRGTDDDDDICKRLLLEDGVL